MVKSVSSSLAPDSVPAQEQESAERLPQAQVEPAGLVFSVEEREQVQAPAARWSEGAKVSIGYGHALRVPMVLRRGTGEKEEGTYCKSI